MRLTTPFCDRSTKHIPKLILIDFVGDCFVELAACIRVCICVGSNVRSKMYS